MEIVLFPQPYIELQQEITMHPTLRQQLEELPPEADLADKMGVVCAYCGIILDGYYDAEEVEHLVDECINRLRKARAELVEDIMKPIEQVNAEAKVAATPPQPPTPPAGSEIIVPTVLSPRKE